MTMAVQQYVLGGRPQRQLDASFHQVRVDQRRLFRDQPRGVAGHEIGIFVDEHQQATRFATDDRHATRGPCA